MPRKRRSCIIDGVRYESEYSAAKALGIGVMLLKRRLGSSNFPNYISKHRKKVKRKKMIASKISCTIKGVKYASVSDAAKKTGVSAFKIFSRLKSLDYPDYVCADIEKAPKPTKHRYMVDGKKYSTLQEIADMEKLTKERIRQKMNSPSHSGYRRLSPSGSVADNTPSPKKYRRKSMDKSCTVDGIRYESQEIAAGALGLGVGTLRYRLRSSNFPTYVSKHHSKIKVRKKREI
ncbi:MAG: hypothetical protein OXF24_00580 [Hyphomicrobiales bacterium]|nr:hypothetical protein [Hyphomicrobiales bacterium]MCY4048071.1 hypothetical protein [Hyphomicrobiales bacterium]MCY4053612.1 hypothetical protein [Hyphomicrobiales bacterium]